MDGEQITIISVAGFIAAFLAVVIATAAWDNFDSREKLSSCVESGVPALECRAAIKGVK